MANIVVFVEVRGGAATAPSRFAVAEARRVATALGATVYALVVTGAASEAALDGLARVLGGAGADRILCCADPSLDGPLLDVTAGPLLATVGERLRPVLALFPAGTVGAALAPPFSLRRRALFQARAALTLEPAREPGRSRLLVQRLRPDGSAHAAAAGEAGPPVVATLGAGEEPPAQGQPATEVESVLPVAGARRLRELGALPDDAEAVELAASIVAAGAVNAAERDLLRAATPPAAAFADGASPGLPAACPARLLVVSRGPAPAPVRAVLSPQTQVAVAGAKAAEKDLPRLDLVWRPAGRQRLAALATALRGDAPDKGPA